MNTRVPLNDLLASYRAAGITDEQIVVVDGCEQRAARMFLEPRASDPGYNRGVQAVCNHHTAGAPGTRPEDAVAFIIDGKGDGFVISNTYVDDPLTTGLGHARIHVIALAGGTYTEGSGGPLGLIPQDGANRVTFSREIENDGTGKRRYHTLQQDLVLRATVAECQLFAAMYDWRDDPFGPTRCFAHHEWTPRKGDPAGEARWQDGTGDRFYDTRSWNMDAFRNDCRQLVAELEDDMVEFRGSGVTEFKRRIKVDGSDRVELSGVTRFPRPDGLPDAATALHLQVTVLSPTDNGWLTSRGGTGEWDETSAGNFSANVPFTSLYPIVACDSDGFAIGVGGTDQVRAVIDVHAWS